MIKYFSEPSFLDKVRMALWIRKSPVKVFAFWSGAKKYWYAVYFDKGVPVRITDFDEVGFDSCIKAVRGASQWCSSILWKD